jgi:hypothetical protein
MNLDKIPKWIPWTCAAAFSLPALFSFLFPAGIFARWTAIAVLLVSLPFLWRYWMPLLAQKATANYPNWTTVGLRWSPYIVVSIGTLLALGPVALGQMPVSQDHVNHYFSTHVLVHEMIPSGRFFGWTDSIGTGYPFGDIYHTAGYMLTGFAHLISFGSISLQTSYAFGIVLAWLIPALAVTAWTKRLAGPWGAALAGLLFTLDVGGDREGGWGYAMFHGVWPQRFGLGVWLFALLALWRLIEKPDTRRFASAVLLGGAALWMHPMNSLTLVIAGTLMLAIRLLVTTETKSEDVKTGEAARLVWALFFSGITGLIWIIRMMLGSDEVYAFHSNWEPVSTFTSRMLEGRPFDNQLVLVTALVMVGIAYAIRTGGRFRTFAVTLPAVLIIIGSMDLLVGADLGLAGGKLGLLQYRRFAIPAKPLWYALAGTGLSVIGAGMVNYGGALVRRTVNRLPGQVLVATILAPFVWGLILAAPGIVKSPAASALTAKRTGDEENLAALRNALAKEQKRCSAKFCRAVYWEKPGHGGLYPVISFADLNYEWLPMLKLPANNFRRQGVAKTVETMIRLGATVAVSKWPQKHPALKEVGRFGKHYLYRISGTGFTRVEIEGPGQVQVISWEPERRVIRLAGTAQTTRLTFLNAPYRKWHARQGDIERQVIGRTDNGPPLTEVLNIDDGELVLEYSDDLLETLFSFIGFIVVLACVFGLIMVPHPLPEILNGYNKPIVPKILLVFLLAIISAGALAVVTGGRESLEREWLRNEPAETEIETVLHRKGAASIRFTPENPCIEAYTRNPHWDCTKSSFSPRLVPAPRRNGKVPSCLSIGVPENGTTEITFDLPRDAARIKGRIHLVSGKKFDANIHTAKDNLSIKQSSRRGTDFTIASGGDSATIKLSAKEETIVCIEAVALSVGR